MGKQKSKKNTRAETPSNAFRISPTQTPQETVLLIGGILLLLLLVYIIIPIISPFVVVAAILFLLYPLRHRSLTRTVMWLAVLLFTLWFVYSLGGILLPFIIAFLLAYLFDPLINAMEEWKIPRWVSSLVILVVFIGLAATGTVFVMPVALNQFQGIIDGISSIVNDVVALIQRGQIFAALRTYGFPVERLQEILSEKLTPRLETILKGLLEGGLGVISSVSTLVTHIVNAIIIPVLAFYMMKDFPIITHRFKMIIPKTHRENIAEYVRKIDELFGRYLRGAFTVAFIHGILASLLLWLFGIRYPLVLGMMAGVLSLIPYFGLLTSLVLSILVALFSGEPASLKVLFVLLTFGFLQILEFSVLSPNILGKQIGLHPVLLILSLLVFGFFLGFIGLLIAVPTTAIVIMIVKEWEYRKRARQLVLM